MSVEMTRDDVIRSTAAHIRRVGELMVKASSELAMRAVVHDASKWSPDEWPDFERQTPILAGLTYGSDEYKAACKALGPALKMHYERNSHHPEFYETGIGGMTLLDLVEMLCDWKAASERHDNGDILQSLAHNAKRFQIDPQLHAILYRTIGAFGWAETWVPVLTIKDDA